MRRRIREQVGEKALLCLLRASGQTRDPLRRAHRRTQAADAGVQAGERIQVLVGEQKSLPIDDHARTQMSCERVGPGRGRDDDLAIAGHESRADLPEPLRALPAQLRHVLEDHGSPLRDHSRDSLRQRARIQIAQKARASGVEPAGVLEREVQLDVGRRQRRLAETGRRHQIAHAVPLPHHDEKQGIAVDIALLRQLMWAHSMAQARFEIGSHGLHPLRRCE